MSAVGGAVTDAHGADQLGHLPRPGFEQASTARNPTWPREPPQWCYADRDWMTALGPTFRDRRSRAALAILHSVTAQLSAHMRGPAPTVAGPPRYTVLPAIYVRRYQPEPAPLHAGEDDSGDTGRRSSTPTRSPTRHP